MADTDAPNGEFSSSDSWSEADYPPALRHLQDIQSQIDNLRASIPSIIAPLITAPDTSPISTVPPHKIYSEFASQATQAMADLKTLRETWEKEQTKNILQRAEERLDMESEVDWEFVQLSRSGEIPQDESKDVEMKTNDAEKETESSKESSEAK